MADRVPAGRPPRGGFAGKTDLKSLDKAVLKRLLSYFIPYKWTMLAVFACIILSAVAQTRGAQFIQTVIDDHITPMLTSGSRDFGPLALAIVQMAVLYAVGVVSALLYNRLMVNVGQGIQKSIRDGMFSKMQTFPISFFDTHPFGDVMSHYTNDIDTLRQMISQSIPQAISSLVTIVTVFVFMVATDVVMTAFVLLTIAFMAVFIKLIGGRSGKYFVKQQSSLGKLNGFIEERVTGQKVIKVFNHEQANKEEFDVLNDELYENSSKANIFANILFPVMGNLTNLQYVLVAIFGGALAIKGVNGLTLGTVIAFLQLSHNFTMPITQVSQQLNAVVMALAGAKRIFDLLDEKSEENEGYVTLANIETIDTTHANVVDNDIVEIDEKYVRESEKRTGIWAWKHPHGDGRLTYTPLRGDVRFYNVDFGYTPDKQVLHDISLYAKPGQKVAFVGSTGAGKTTITNLINRFYDIADGKIRYDNININKINKSDLRRSLGIVLQEVNLFTGTVMDNIRYGRLDATDEECVAAAKLAGADGFIRMLPKGYQTEIAGSGSDLSQGQRQLLSIARAAVADPPVMILDEATSSIDTRTEAIVQKGMDALMEGRTVFVIAHRLSTVRNADVIMVLEHGVIVERGTHEELLALKGRYYNLYTGKFELD
ncbi:MAG: ABC transporter ATP-binding protein/permease [Clostridia bacterium]|nr:ABC transporter ATP-binding protein/permease [Clostridia bacterium]